MPTMHTRSRLPRQESEPMVYPAEASTDEPRNAMPLHRYVADLWRGMSDGARFVFWLLMAILLVAGAVHVALRLAAI